MKKIIVSVLSVLVIAFSANAQSKALGIRVGGDAEVSYQHYFGSNFLEGDLGLAFANSGMQLSGIYNYVFANVSNFNFYVGPGVQFNIWNDSERNKKFGVGVGGQIGVEYQFGIPFNLSLDWRPMWNFIGRFASWSSFAIGFRYRF